MKEHESLESIMSEAKGMTFEEMCEWIKREQDKREDFEAEVAQEFGGCNGFGKALIVDSLKLEDVLRQDKCIHCYCKNYCFNPNVYTNCVDAKKAYLMGELEEYASELGKKAYDEEEEDE